MNVLNKHRSVAFTGHRRIPTERQDSLRDAIKEKVVALCAMGVTDYYCGMVLGFDMLAAEAVLSLKSTLPKLRLIAVVPYRGQSDAWSRIEQELHAAILAKADELIVLSERYYKGCLLRRNDFMLSHVSGVVAYFNGSPKGGTFYTCREASHLHLDIINLYNHQTSQL
jgi:uncharacterized phage-like protein YoqJ